MQHRHGISFKSFLICLAVFFTGGTTYSSGAGRSFRASAADAFPDSVVSLSGTPFMQDSLESKGNMPMPEEDTVPSWKHMLNDTLTVTSGAFSRASREQLIRSGELSRQQNAREAHIEDSLRMKHRTRIFRDTLPLSRMSALSLVMPGFSQFYNGQYWKIPVLYTSVAGFATLGFYTNNKFNRADARYNQAVYDKADQNLIDRYQRERNRYNTQRTLFFGGAALSYLYFIGDGVINYKGHATNIKKATTLAMVFPGAGQAYNKSYWKIPIIYGGFATFGYVIDYNNRGYQRYKKAYNAITDNDPNTVDEFNGRFSSTLIQNARNSFRRARDLSIIYTCAFYILTIVDAHVDAYFQNYDVSEDLSVRVEPSVFNHEIRTARAGTPSGNTAVGLSMKLNF